MNEAAPLAEDPSTCPLLHRLVKAARLAHLSCGPPFYWWPLRPGFPEKWMEPVLGGRCFPNRLSVFTRDSQQWNLEGIGLARLCHCSS